MKDTGFKCYNETLYVGDVLSVHSGYMGFMKVVELEDGFYLVDDSNFPDEANETVKLDRNIKQPYRKVDKNNRYKEPPFPIYCDQCEETVVGEFDVEVPDGDNGLTWNENCAYHEELEGEHEGKIVRGICKLCESDPTRKTYVDPVMQYFYERYEKAEFKVVPGHWPDFQNEKEVDEWINNMEKITRTFDKAFEEETDK